MLRPHEGSDNIDEASCIPPDHETVVAPRLSLQVCRGVWMLGVERLHLIDHRVAERTPEDGPLRFHQLATARFLAAVFFQGVVVLSSTDFAHERVLHPCRSVNPQA